MHLLRNCLLALSLMGLIACSSTPDGPTKPSALRDNALKEAALTYGAQSALAWKATILNATLSYHAKKLDHIYRFNNMLLHNNVVPPVLNISNNSLNLSNPNAIRASDQIVRIISPARFVTTPPTWRTYLSQHTIKAPNRPNTLLLPHNERERRIWDQYIQTGWARGLTQASNLFYMGLGKLNRDFTGMAVYHKLLAQHMVLPPYVASSSMGITGNRNHMRINDKVYRITQHAALLPQHTNRWKAILIHAQKKP
jgi:defect in organelle trafficking protein DotC